MNIRIHISPKILKLLSLNYHFVLLIISTLTFSTAFHPSFLNFYWARNSQIQSVKLGDELSLLITHCVSYFREHPYWPSHQHEPNFYLVCNLWVLVTICKCLCQKFQNCGTALSPSHFLRWEKGERYSYINYFRLKTSALNYSKKRNKKNKEKKPKSNTKSSGESNVSHKPATRNQYYQAFGNLLEFFVLFC